MYRLYTFISILILITQTGLSQVTVDEETLSEAIKEKMMDEITDRIKSSVESGEAWVANQTYFSIVLEPFEAFGIDPSNPNFLNQAYEIHEKIEEKLKDNPNLRGSDLLKDEIKGIVKQGLWNYAGTFIDDDSKEIYDQVTGLVSDGTQKINDLLEAVNGINSIDPEDSDYESEVVAILKKYGIESDYFYIIDDLDQVISAGYEQIADPLDALTKVVSAVRSDDPVYKIEMLFDLGETYGSKIPVIGDLVTPIFTMGKGVLQAALQLENVLEKNLNQGCISPGGGTYGYVNSDKRHSFVQKFSHVERGCPISESVYSPVFSNIYFNTANSGEIFFYMNNKWFRGKNDDKHNGVNDIKATVQWLRRNGHVAEAVDLEFIFTSYQKEYGWSAYTKELTDKIDRISILFHLSYSTIQSCDDAKLKEFYMEKTGFNWITRLMKMEGLDFEWNDLKLFNDYWKEEIKNRMIYNYYLSKHLDDLNQLDNIISSLTKNVPVNIYGTVTENNGTPIQNAKLYTGQNSMFEEGDKCHQTTTSLNGNYSYYLLLPLTFDNNTTVSANIPDGRTIVEDITIHPNKKRIYNVNLIMPYIPQQDTSTASSPPDSTSVSGVTGTDTTSGSDTTTIPVNTTTCEDPNAIATTDPTTGQTICVCKQNYKQDPATGNCVIDIAGLITASDCANDPNAIAEWDPINQRVNCSCIDYYIWDASIKKCVPDIQTIIANSDCSRWPNTEAKWDYSIQEPYCDCKAGFEWNENYTECVSKQDNLVANSDCSYYPNTKPVWDPVSQEVICDCLPGYDWDKDYTKCISKSQQAVQTMDCSNYPNTRAKWDPATNQPYCDCIAGYKWKDDYSACEKIQQQTQQPQQTYNCDHIPNSHPVFDRASNTMVCDCNPGYKWNRNFTACDPVPKPPDVDWDGIIATTIDIMNAVNNPQGTGGMPSGGGSGGSNQPPVTHQSNCNDQQKQGGDAPEIHNIDLGTTFGSFVLDYDVYTVKDQIIVTQGGIKLYDSGCVSGSQSIRLNLNGYSSKISVRINPNCAGESGTSWTFTVHCPN
jgi:hypothetical protein